MSAPNFSTSHNSRHLYAFMDYSDYEEYKKQYIAETYEDEDEVPSNIDEWLYSDWHDMEKEYHLEHLHEKLNEKFDDFSIDNEDPCDGEVFASIYRQFDFAGYKWDIELDIVLEAGYYQGFALDWNIAKCEYLDYLPDADDCRDMLYFNADKNEGLSRMLSGKLAARFKKEIEQLGDEISDVLEAVAPYCLEGHVLCNGEGIYHKVA